ncbi:methyltransferase domain-containing protein [Saccharopolyspora sp. NPDC002686]|uniref:class I SAM-dependent methyltransferase n=1 Tax=Saccharopolyspora sp. NPDC002686 TaxID=3154541 RepID=UPI0033243DD7
MALTYWERVAESRWGRYITAEEERAIVLAGDQVGAPGRALDIGCDGGRWARVLERRGWKVTCTDVDDDAIRLCTEQLPQVQCIRVNPSDTRLPLADASVSLALCIEVIAVVSSEWFAEEAARVLAPGGMLVATAWNRSSPRGLAACAVSRLRDRKPHPFYGHSYHALRRKLRAAGFEICSEQGLCWFPFSRASDSRLIPVAAKLEKATGLDRLALLSPWVLVTARKGNRT